MVTDMSFPLFYIPHGGDPCFFMKESFGPPGTWDKMGEHLRGLSALIGRKPRAILVISAHWEETKPTLQSNPSPPLLFDYYGFPDYTYRLTYPAPGAPDLVKRVQDLLGTDGIPSDVNPDRGYDHGVFIPFLLIYPQADIPIVQISLRSDLDPAFHVRMGQALAPLADEGVLMVGSGMSYHNLRALMGQSPPKHTQDAQDFDHWLGQTIALTDTNQRNHLLEQWDAAPGARSAHPREEHLLPLMVIAGAAKDKLGRVIYSDTIINKPVSSFMFGNSFF